MSTFLFCLHLPLFKDTLCTIGVENDPAKESMHMILTHTKTLVIFRCIN